MRTSVLLDVVEEFTGAGFVLVGNPDGRKWCGREHDGVALNHRADSLGAEQGADELGVGWP